MITELAGALVWLSVGQKTSCRLGTATIVLSWPWLTLVCIDSTVQDSSCSFVEMEKYEGMDESTLKEMVSCVLYLVLHTILLVLHVQ